MYYMARRYCPICGRELIKFGKAVAGYTKVQLYLCGKCNKLFAEGAVEKRPFCPKCGKPMRKCGRVLTPIGTYMTRWRCDRCKVNIYLTKTTLPGKRPRCLKCGAPLNIRDRKSRRVLLKCPRCGASYLALLGRVVARKHVKKGIVVKLVELPFDISRLPKEIRRAIETWKPRWLREVDRYRGPLTCPRCEGKAVKDGSWSRNGVRIQKYKCRKCGAYFSPRTFIAMIIKATYPPCPECLTNKHVVRDGFAGDDKQRYLCRKCGRSFTVPQIQWNEKRGSESGHGICF